MSRFHPTQKNFQNAMIRFLDKFRETDHPESSRDGSFQVACLDQQSRDFQLAADIRLVQRTR